MCGRWDREVWTLDSGAERCVLSLLRLLPLQEACGFEAFLSKDGMLWLLMWASDFIWISVGHPWCLLQILVCKYFRFLTYFHWPIRYLGLLLYFLLSDYIVDPGYHSSARLFNNTACSFWWPPVLRSLLLALGMSLAGFRSLCRDEATTCRARSCKELGKYRALLLLCTSLETLVIIIDLGYSGKLLFWVRHPLLLSRRHARNWRFSTISWLDSLWLTQLRNLHLSQVRHSRAGKILLLIMNRKLLVVILMLLRTYQNIAQFMPVQHALIRAPFMIVDRYRPCLIQELVRHQAVSWILEVLRPFGNRRFLISFSIDGISLE